MRNRVSIHASVKDATKTFAFRIQDKLVSIHASVKDATKKTYNRWITTDVSIHASVKDATYHVCFKIFRWGFNPRICKRCDGKDNV